jgi:hypothetical protein
VTSWKELENRGRSGLMEGAGIQKVKGSHGRCWNTEGQKDLHESQVISWKELEFMRLGDWITGSWITGGKRDLM